jgi:hypothetical protein
VSITFGFTAQWGSRIAANDAAYFFQNAVA